jgi:hypothetical protein
MRILRRGNPNMTSEQAANNAEQMIRAMHMHGYQMGPLASFGPHDGQAGPRDAFDNFDEVLTLLEERQPWNPPELRR